MNLTLPRENVLIDKYNRLVFDRVKQHRSYMININTKEFDIFHREDYKYIFV